MRLLLNNKSTMICMWETHVTRLYNKITLQVSPLRLS